MSTPRGTKIGTTKDVVRRIRDDGLDRPVTREELACGHIIQVGKLKPGLQVRHCKYCPAPPRKPAPNRWTPQFKERA